MTYTNRRSFGQAVRRARRAGTIKEYARDSYGYSRMVSLTDGTFLLYRLREMPPDERDEAYERAAARARGNDFAATNGRDWT